MISDKVWNEYFSTSSKTLSYGILFSSQNSSSYVIHAFFDADWVAFFDVDWVGCQDDQTQLLDLPPNLSIDP